jgi:hypothetical protein
MKFVREEPRETPVIKQVDVCVLGGSCTGVFAAIAAARRGMSVAIVESQSSFGGTAASGMVCYWHTLFDHKFETQIVGGLTEELINRLKKRNAVDIKEAGRPEGNTKRGAKDSRIDLVPYSGEKLLYRMENILAYFLNSEELKIELDEMVLESGTTPYLHTQFVSPHLEDAKLTAIIIENKSGRSAIEAKVFIDATGDGSLCRDLGIEYYKPEERQPATTCAFVYGLDKIENLDFYNLVLSHMQEYNLPSLGWSSYVPSLPELTLLAETRIREDTESGDGLTAAEIEGRRQLRAIMDIVRKYSGAKEVPVLASMASHIGIRESCRIKCRYCLTGQDVLDGRHFPDAIANMSYPIDIHGSDGQPTLHRYMDGYEEVILDGGSREKRRWKPECENYNTYYQIPYRCLLPKGDFDNLLVCGRSIDTDKDAFGAVRVMLATNQEGEAAGVAAAVSIKENMILPELNTEKLREELASGGAIVL